MFVSTLERMMKSFFFKKFDQVFHQPFQNKFQSLEAARKVPHRRPEHFAPAGCVLAEIGKLR